MRSDLPDSFRTAFAIHIPQKKSPSLPRQAYLSLSQAYILPIGVI
jgi:hypothetical protein